MPERMRLRQDGPLSMIRWAIRSQGWGVTALSIVFKVIALTGLDLTRAEWYRDFRDRRLDRRFNIDTAGALESHELGVAEEKISVTGPYGASTPLAFHLIFSTMDIPYERYTFVDIGSGKGRALFLASEYPFRRIVGVELSRGLHDSACENIRNYRSPTRKCAHIDSVHCDATDFDFPDGPLIVYLFNPFPEVVLSRVIDRLRRANSKSLRHIVIVYFHPMHNDLFEREDFLTPVSFEDGLRGPLRRLMPVHKKRYAQQWVGIYETEQDV